MPFLLALGDDQARGDVAQAVVVLAQVQRHRQHGVINYGGAADGFAACPGGFVAFEGPVAEVWPFHPGQGCQHGEHHPGRIVGALQFAGEELQPDAGGLELLGQGGEFDAAPEAFVFVHAEGDRGAGGADPAGQGDGVVEFGAGLGRGWRSSRRRFARRRRRPRNSPTS